MWELNTTGFCLPTRLATKEFLMQLQALAGKAQSFLLLRAPSQFCIPAVRHFEVHDLRCLTFELSWHRRCGAPDSKRKLGRRPCA